MVSSILPDKRIGSMYVLSTAERSVNHRAPPSLKDSTLPAIFCICSRSLPQVSCRRTRHQDNIYLLHYMYINNNFNRLHTTKKKLLSSLKIHLLAHTTEKIPCACQDAHAKNSISDHNFCYYKTWGMIVKIASAQGMCCLCPSPMQDLMASPNTKDVPPESKTLAVYRWSWE